MSRATSRLLAVVAAVTAVLPAAAAPAAAGAGAASATVTPSPSAVFQGSLPQPAQATLPAPLAVGSGVTPAPAALAHLLAPLLHTPALGGTGGGAVVADATTGQIVYDERSGVAVAPASTAKLATAVAALTELGPAATLTTRVVEGARPGSIVLVGGGDPTLAGPEARPAYPAAGRLGTLAAATARALRAKGVASVSVGYDASVFTGPTTGPGWKPGYVSDGDVGPVVGLETDEGRARPDRRARLSDAPRAAALDFATLLRHAGVTVAGRVAEQAASPAGVPVASVHSAPVSALVEHMLEVSDNDLAEALARQVAIHRHAPATFAGAAAAVRQVVTSLGVDTTTMQMYDGSGLSPQDRLAPVVLVRLLALAASPDHPELRPVLSGLPVAHFSGTLADRFGHGPAALAGGAVRAKTGTLLHVSSLAGYLVDRDGRELVFAFLDGVVPSRFPNAAESALDRAAAALAGCGCS